MKRREFIILTGVGATSTTMLSACGHPENKLIPALIPDDQYVPGIDYWKASTCAMCSAGCGILVRTREHKANKIEGNPRHPVNRGALCARGQAGLQVLYNPDRIPGPLKRVGERGSGRFEAIEWDQAIKTLAERLGEIKAERSADSILFASKASLGVTGLAAELLAWTIRVRLQIAEGSAGGSGVTHSGSVPRVFDIANATYLLSFGARFLETWHSPVMYSLAYGEFRRSSGKVRGRFVQVEPRMSLTGANADEWVPAAANSEALIALGIAQVIVREGLIKNAPRPDFLAEPFEDLAPERTAERTGIAAERVIRIAREFAASEHPLAIGAGASGPPLAREENAKAIDYLNKIAGNLNKPGGVLLTDGEGFDPFEELRGRAKAARRAGGGGGAVSPGKIGSLEAPRVQAKEWEDRVRWMRETGWPTSAYWLSGREAHSALLIHHVNPVYFAPKTEDWIRRVPFIASFSSFMDETTQLADLILPDHSFLEGWDIHSTPLAGSRVAVSILQPVVKPEHNTRQTADVLLAISRELGSTTADSPPFDSSESIVKQVAGTLLNKGKSKGAEQAGDPVKSFSESGVSVADVTGAADRTADGRPTLLRTEVSLQPSETTDGDGYPLTLLTYEDAALGLGEQANLPLLQELPDPMTSVMWGSWVEINPKTAGELGIEDGDLVEVATSEGSVRAPAVLYPAIRPDVIAMPLGQGHTAYGRYAKDRGVNPVALLPGGLLSDGATVRAKVAKVGAEGKLVRFGTELFERMELKR